MFPKRVKFQKCFPKDSDHLKMSPKMFPKDSDPKKFPKESNPKNVFQKSQTPEKCFSAQLSIINPGDQYDCDFFEKAT